MKYISRFDLHIRMLLLPLFFVVIWAILFILTLRLNLQTQKVKIVPAPVQYTLQPYPQFIKQIDPYVTSQAAVILEPDSQVFLYQKQPFVHYSLASTTKIMTALVALQHYQPDDVLTVQRNYVEGSVLHLYAGEQLYFDDALYAMLLNSANDAAYTIADNYPGGMSSFVKAMNVYARQLNLNNTKYVDPAGLEDDGDFTTVVDLSRLAAIALQNQTFHRIVGTKYKIITSVDGINQYALMNLNQLLGYDGVIGVKTGTTEGAGQVLVTAKQDGAHTYILVVMQSTDRYFDTRQLLSSLDSNVQFIAPESLLGTR